MIKHWTLSVLMFMTLAPVFAQTEDNEESYYNLWNPQPGATMVVFADKAYIRTEPSLQGSIADSLTPGTTVTAIQQTGRNIVVKGITAPWLKISYNREGKAKEGYVWLGLLALGRYTTENTDIIYGLERGYTVDDFFRYNLRVKAIDANLRVLDMKEKAIDGESSASTEGKLLGDLGLENTKNILRIYFSGDACGLPTNYYYFGWTGTNFLELPGKMSVGDAGAYYHSETLLFPKEAGGQPGKIIRLTEDEEVGEDGETVAKKTYSREVYLWDGRQAVKQ
ncbi:SH3 domain-containing protein [Chitinophaga tropicalis]|uniref:SH3 domain-containing protein n=1 Tax=Chitinophaga tropicalis TaxID=2683588 RepID=A0A7K1U5X3_9BACT|nr:SH3 domain-containing protein [Chitinophaga tropicalis]MVT09355.1 SH3 domain-containing protein [Chitinophaga tropicalis]